MKDPGRLADELSALLELLYAAAAEPSLWPRFMERLSDTLAGPVAFHVVGENGAAFEHAIRWDPALLAEYMSHWSRVNPFLPPQRTRPPGVGDVILSSEMFPDSRLPGTEFYDGFLKPQGLFYGVGLVFQKSPSHSTRVTLSRGLSKGPYDEWEQRLLRLLGPHLDRAFVIQQKIGCFEERSRAFAEVVASLPIALFLLNTHGTVFFANERAERLLGRKEGIALDAHRQLVTANRKESVRLRQLVQHATQTSARSGLDAGGNMLLGRSGQRPLHACVLPLRAHQYQVGGASAAVAVLVTEPERRVELSPRVARSLYDLTPAEARLASRLLGGQTLQEIATELVVSPNTLRAQLKSVFAKTGTRRQSELVHLLALGPGLTAPTATPSPT